MAELITTNDRLGRIVSRHEFAGMAQFIFPFPRSRLLTVLMKQMKLSGLRRLAGAWNMDDAADGLNRLIDLVDQGCRVRYDIWSEADKAEDPRKQDTALFHFPVHQKGPFVLVCAGGAYAAVASFIEGFPVAAELNRLGYSAFVLHYRTGSKNLWPAPLEDLQQALHFVFDHAPELDVETEGYAVAGFSAGGHIAASLGTDNFGYQKWGLPGPAALFLGYPVTMYDHMTRIHRQSRDTIIGREPAREQIDAINVVLHAGRDYPPTFLMHCRDDDAVYFENAEMLAKRLEELGVPCILKAVPAGGHGIGLGNGTQAQGWLAEAVHWWQGRRHDQHGASDSSVLAG